LRRLRRHRRLPAPVLRRAVCGRPPTTRWTRARHTLIRRRARRILQMAVPGPYHRPPAPIARPATATAPTVVRPTRTRPAARPTLPTTARGLHLAVPARPVRRTAHLAPVT